MEVVNSSTVWLLCKIIGKWYTCKSYKFTGTRSQKSSKKPDNFVIILAAFLCGEVSAQFKAGFAIFRERLEQIKQEEK